MCRVFHMIVATIGRTKELRRLLESLTQQEFSDFEVIVVDQNDDNRLDEVMDEFDGRVPLMRIFSAKGVSRARNAVSGRLQAISSLFLTMTVGIPPASCRSRSVVSRTS